jgi:hypothetical protein
MKFHEDVIFKVQGQDYGQILITLIKIKGKVIKVLQTEYGVVDPKMYKPDLVFELEDRIVIFEFQSTYVDINDKRRFRFYTALIDHVKIKSSKPIEVHVLSTVEGEKTKWYNVSEESAFPIYIHSLKHLDGEKFLNMMNDKIGHDATFSEEELLMTSLICFMDFDKDVERAIYDSATTIAKIKTVNEDMTQFVKGLVLILCDKFVKDESLNETISNLVGGNMKIVEEYAQRKVDQKTRDVVINLDNLGFTIEDIAKTADVSLDFVKKTLSK